MTSSLGIRELKAGLSECVRRASAGERIIVTDRGRPVAQLAPLSDLDRIEQGIKEGRLIPPKRPGPLEPIAPPLSRSGRSIAELLDEDRGD